MRTTNSIVIKAPIYDIFSTASDLLKWPLFLPHYRYTRFLSQMPWGGIIKMSAKRTGIPVTWISVFKIDAEQRQLQFEHIKGVANATKGMVVVWNFEEYADGVRVEITHELNLKWPIIGGLVANLIVGKFFIHHIANRTLRGLKRHLEGAS